MTEDRNSADSVDKVNKLLKNGVPVILYLGARGKESFPVAGNPWSLVATSMYDDELPKLFTIPDRRRVIIIRDLNQMLETARLSQRELDLLFI